MKQHQTSRDCPTRLQTNSSMHLFFTNNRPAPDVLSEPAVELHHWRILRRGNGTLHIAAQVPSGSFRVTSPLITMDLAQSTARTESGRSYRLCAPPEEDPVLRALMTANASRDLVLISDDISDAIWDAVKSGVWPRGMDSLLPPSQ